MTDHNPFNDLPFLRTGTTTGPAPHQAPEPMTQPIARPTHTPASAPTAPAVVPAPRPVPTRTGAGWNPQPPSITPPATVPSMSPPPVSDDWSDPNDFDWSDPHHDDDGPDDDQRQDSTDRSGLARTLRKILGLDRAPKNRSAAADGEDSDWLDDHDTVHEPAPVAAASSVKQSTSVPATPRGTDSRNERPRERPDRAPADGVAVSDARPGWPARAGKIAIWVLLGLIFFAGVNQVILRPIFGSGGQEVVEQAPAVEASAAQAAAIRYALDYFSYSPDTAAAGTAALRADVDSSTVKRWTGTGYLAADSAAAGPLVTIDNTTALVPVTLRIRLAMPPARGADTATAPTGPAAADTSVESAPAPSTDRPSAASAAPTVPGGAAGDPGQIPAGWSDLGSRWVTVSVPVRVGADGSVKATGGGAVLVGESVTTAIGPVEPMADADLSSSTQTAVDRFFTGYAASDTSYVSAPGVDMSGLNGIVTAGDRTRWSADLPVTDGTNTTVPTDITQLTGTAGVTWQLTGTDLSIVQTYRAAMTLSQGRWYVATLAPSLTNQ